MPVIVKCGGSTTGQRLPFVGKYLVAYDLEFDNGIGICSFSSDPKNAMRFADLAAFHAAYRATPICRPLRFDGRPNRPLTSTHWEIITVNE